MDADYNASSNDKSNIFNEWFELAKKLEVLLENRVMKDTTFIKQVEEIQLYKKDDGNKM